MLCRFPVKLTVELMQVRINTCWWGIVIQDEHHTFRVALTADDAAYLPLLKVIAPDHDNPKACRRFLRCKRASDSTLHVYCEDAVNHPLSW